MPPKHNIIEELRRAIRDSGESEYSIGKATGVSQSILSRFVNGERGISLETAAKLCEHLEFELRRRR